MAGAVVGAVRVDLGMNTIAFQNGIKRAQQGMQQFQKGAANVARAAGEMSREMRERDIQAYGAAMDGLRAKFNPLYGAIRNYRDTVAEIRQAHAVGAISADEMTAAINRERTASLASIQAIKGRTTALTQMGGASRLAAANARNLSFQLIDIGQGIPLMFQSPLYGLQNLGFQIAQISQLYMGQGGLKQALVDVGGQLLAFTRYLGPAAIAVGAVAAGVAGLTNEINQSAQVQVGFFDVVQAGFSLIAEQIMAVVQPAISQMMTWFQQLWGVVAPVMKNIGNAIVGTFVFAFDAAVATWTKLPAAMGDIIIKVANIVVVGIETAINRAAELLDAFINKANQNLAGIGLAIPNVGRVDFGGFSNPYAGASSEYGAAIGDAASGAFSTDYLGGAFDALSERAQEIALARQEMEALDEATKGAGGSAKELGDKLSEAAKAAKAEWDFYRSTFSGFFSDLKSGLQEGKGFWQSFGEAASNALNKILDRWLDLIANNLFGSLFGMPGATGVGGGMGGGILGGLFGGIGKLFGFAQGGQFRVGGSGGIDSQLVAFKASPDETVSVTKPGQQARMAQPVRVELAVQEGSMFEATVRRISGEGDVRVVKSIERGLPGMMAEAQQRQG